MIVATITIVVAMSSCISRYPEFTYNERVQYTKLNPDEIIKEGKTLHHWTNDFAQKTHLFQSAYSNLTLNRIGIKAESTILRTIPDYTISDLMNALPSWFEVDGSRFFFTLETSNKGVVLTYSNNEKEVLFLVEEEQLVDALAKMLIEVSKYNNNHFYSAEIEYVY